MEGASDVSNASTLPTRTIPWSQEAQPIRFLNNLHRTKLDPELLSRGSAMKIERKSQRVPEPVVGRQDCSAQVVLETRLATGWQNRMSL